MISFPQNGTNMFTGAYDIILTRAACSCHSVIVLILCCFKYMFSTNGVLYSNWQYFGKHYCQCTNNEMVFSCVLLQTQKFQNLGWF